MRGSGWQRGYSRRDGAVYFVDPSGRTTFEHPGHADAAPYTHLTPPTNREVYLSVVVAFLKNNVMSLLLT